MSNSSYQELNIPSSHNENLQPARIRGEINGAELLLTPIDIIAIGDDLYQARINVASRSAELNTELREQLKPSLSTAAIRLFIPGFDKRGSN